MPLPFSSISSERLQKILPGLAALLFTALIGLETARIFWLVFPEPDGGAWVPRPARPQNAPKATVKTLDIRPLIAAKPFGEYVEAPLTEVVAETTDAPDTNLRLKLNGIFAMEDPSKSRALIEANNGQEESYSVGMKIPGGVSLHAIYPDRVLLKRGGRLETLRLEKDAPSTAISTVSTPPSVSSNGTGSAATILDSDTAQKLTSIRNELLEDPTKASQYLRVQPARSDGAMKGYRVYPGRNRELFKEAGLRPGDIITAINGQSLDDPSRSLQLLSELSSAQQINIEIERGGQLQSLSVNLN